MRLSALHLYAGKTIPSGYGIAWYCSDQHAVVVLPIPVNLVAGFCRWVWLCAQRGWQLPERVVTVTVHATREERRDAFIEGQTFFKECILADIDKRPLPPLPEYARDRSSEPRVGCLDRQHPPAG